MASPRRNSTGKLVCSIPKSPSSEKEKAIPHYLRASTGSCHDFCKYGRKNSSEVKERHPFLLRRSGANATASRKEDSTGGLKAIGTKKSLGRLRGSSARKVTADRKIKTGVLAAQLPASGTTTSSKDSKETDDVVEQTVAAPECESLEESARTPITNEDVERIVSVTTEPASTPVSSTMSSVSSADDTAAYEPESIPPIAQDIHVVETVQVLEKQVCSVQVAEIDRVLEKQVCSVQVAETDPVLEKQVCSVELEEKQVCSVHVEVAETGQVLEKEVCPVPVVVAEAEEEEEKLPIRLQPTDRTAADSTAIPRIVGKEGRLSVKKSLESVAPKVVNKLETSSSPASALPGVEVGKQTTTVGKPTATSLRPTVKAAKQSAPITTTRRRRSRSPPRTWGKFNVTPAAPKSKSPSLGGPPKKATPSSLRKTRPTSDSPCSGGGGGSRLAVSTPPAKVKVDATPSSSSKSKSSLGSSGGPRATPSSKSVSKPPRNPSTRVSRTNLESKKSSGSSRVGPSPRDSTNRDPRTKLMRSGSLKAPVSLKNPARGGAGSGDEKSNRWRASRRSSLSSLSSFLSRGSDELGDGSNRASREVRWRYGLNKNPKATAKKGRMGTGLRQERESTAYKMKFRRGKVVSAQPETNTLPPRRLTFRCRRVLGRSPSGRRGADALQRRQSDVASRSQGNDANAGGGSGRSVALRHRNAEGKKKDNQALLLNQVIEETASKLVETRKSKVKALVGAFETVISLHESKPAA